MTWHRIKHVCDLPIEHTPGDVWQCDDCGRYWRWTSFGVWTRLRLLGRIILRVDR